MNAYEEALERFEWISRNHRKLTELAEALVSWADDEYNDAQDNLRRYESFPGIALPEYRETDGLYWDSPEFQQANPE